MAIQKAQILRRQIELKRQARDLIGDEIVDLQIRLALVTHKQRLETQIEEDFNSVISRKIDCILYLLES